MDLGELHADFVRIGFIVELTKDKASLVSRRWWDDGGSSPPLCALLSFCFVTDAWLLVVHF